MREEMSGGANKWTKEEEGGRHRWRSEVNWPFKIILW